MSKNRTVELLDLRFRAEPAPIARGFVSASWWFWCCLALVTGYGLWLASRNMLAGRLSDRLATAQSPSDAFLALEGLLMLDAEATLEITRGLQHPNAQVARTAYRTLDAQITGWQQLESSVAAARMRSLSQRLSELPETTPADNLILAGSLASRIFTICLELDDPQLAPVMVACESIFQRIGPARLHRSAADLAASDNPNQEAVGDLQLEELGARVAALRPPPPLRLPEVAVSAALSDDQFTSAARQPAFSPPPQSVPAQLASTGLSSSTAGPRLPTLEANPVSVSLGNNDSGFVSESRNIPDPQASSDSDTADSAAVSVSLRDDRVAPLPSLVHGAGRVEPLSAVRLRKAGLEVDMEAIPEMEIEQLVRLLASSQPRVPQAAALALRAKGLPDQSLIIASELATSSAARRLELLEQIAIGHDVEDPRPWLLWMAKDGQPEVRQRAVTLLSFRPDAFVQRELRQMLTVESDESVAQTIRRALVAAP